MHDVIVVGGGPAGNHAAARLAGAGHSVLVLEAREAVSGKKSCTGIVGRECVEAFGIVDPAVLRKVNSARLFSPSGKELYLHRDEIQACVLDRVALDKIMAERARHSGAEYRYGHRVKDLKTDNEKAMVTVTRTGGEHAIAARAVIVAAGFSPGLISGLGLGTYRDFTIGVQAEVPAPDISEVEVYFGNIAPGFFAWLVPAAPGLAKVGLLCRERPGHYLRNWLAELVSAGKISSSDVKPVYGGIPLRPLPRTYGERLLVIGDAAGQVKPTSCGGIYYGLLGADIAAATLHGALGDDDLSARRLAMYERGWRKKLGGELRTGYWARRLYERLSNRQIDRLFDAIRAGGIDEALLKAPDLSFDWHSRTIVSLLKYRIIASIVGVFKPPFSSSPSRHD